MIWFALFLATTPLSNWLVGAYGLIPVGFGLMAPAAVLAVGPAFVLRDLVHRKLGGQAAFAAIGLGAAASSFLAPPSLVIASTTAFLLSEGADLAVYQPLQRKGFMLAVIGSSLVGIIMDSMVFLLLAFGSLEFLGGQILGKLWMVAGAALVLSLSRPQLQAAE